MPKIKFPYGDRQEIMVVQCEACGYLNGPVADNCRFCHEPTESL